MTDKEALRTKAIGDTEERAKKSRFGLFSQPPPNAVGDDGQYKAKLRNHIQ